MAMVKILGHRGLVSKDNNAPYQNSDEAFDIALSYGDGFETDACVSKDGVVFLIHEAKYVQVPVQYCVEEHLDQASQKIVAGRRLDQMMADEIRSLRLLSGASIPELTDVLRKFTAHKNKIFNIELKGDGVAAHVMKAIDHATLSDQQLIISSFNHPAMFDLAKQRANLSVGLIFALEDQQRTPLFPWNLTANPACYEPFNSDYLKRPDVQEMQPDYIVIGEPVLNAQNIALVKQVLPKSKLAVWVFTERADSDDKQLMQKIKSYEQAGILDIIMVDDARKIK
jgi:glycerophosphoryl diester phosphodiesterase